MSDMRESPPWRQPAAAFCSNFRRGSVARYEDLVQGSLMSAGEEGGGRMQEAVAWLLKSRQFCQEASKTSGAPPPLQLLPSAPVLANPAWRTAPSFAAAAALLQDASTCASSGEAVAPLAEQQEQKAVAVFREIAADQRPGGLRLLGWMLSHVFRWLFNSEMYVDLVSLERLRRLHYRQPQLQDNSRTGAAAVDVAAGQPVQQQRACLIYIPAHKSHLDYLMLSYILWACGLPCPHIVAGANLSLPIVGRLLRACGAFFIRRTSRGSADAHLYKSVLAAYVQALLVAGHHLEFFIEGGRSRDGRVNPPKLGMLRMVVDAVMAGDVDRPVYLVPTAMNADTFLEERSLAAQLAGAPKKSESLAGLASTCWGIVTKAARVHWRRYFLGFGVGGYCGRATVAFGQPISLQQWLQDNRADLEAGGKAERAAVAALGELVTAGIRTTSALPTSALLLGALFAEQHSNALAAPGGNTMQQCNGVTAQASGSVDRQQQPVLRLEHGVEAVLLQHNRLNQLLPWMALGPTALGSVREFQPVLQRLLDSGALVQQPAPSRCVRLVGEGEGQDDWRRAALFAAALLAPLLASYVEALRAMQAALASSGPGGSSSKALCSAAQTKLLALATTTETTGGGSSTNSSSRTARLVVPSVALVQGALRSFAARHSLERRRPPPQRIASSGSDGEDPALADSVAANLCSLDGGDGGGSGSPPAAALTAAAAAAAAGDARQRWVLAQPEAVVSSLSYQIEAFICI
ncbi:hypothetical protein CHLNCDRAFT_135255 [Chlorella variabilis]|uniref:Phospholipid/glycerol acyltransferase domain-containing protein n=1 Tax=Chlorella variabilis TaxID=554065 RepID=E1ZHU1_CHLVA|nr:hypothetical protein CHLNCDRAFT_135255 [Chlorella variabilis]EFN54663.1 hypothetical protein CHLNCDRAFT_135255 [Chlorella variabilis]|eukprot:XP_005846765.1 hypothetical protein CHLNCDRAFT_135255 [Chlorella variabilis]